MTGERELSQALRALETASREDLIRQWRRFYKSEPLRYASREFLVRAIGYAMQEQEFGGLRTPARRELLANAKGDPVSAQASPIKIGWAIALDRRLSGEGLGIGAQHHAISMDAGIVANE